MWPCRVLQMKSVLLAHAAEVGQAVGLCLDEAGAMFVAVNTPEVRRRGHPQRSSGAALNPKSYPQYH